MGIFKELCVIEVEPDGLTFDADSVKAERITEDADYEGVRVTFTAHLERARIPIQIDIGFGMLSLPRPSKLNTPRYYRHPISAFSPIPKKRLSRRNSRPWSRSGSPTAE